VEGHRNRLLPNL